MIEDNLWHFIQSGQKVTSATKNFRCSIIEASIHIEKWFDIFRMKKVELKMQDSLSKMLITLYKHVRQT